MNHSLVTADRATHLKIVAVALVAAITVVAVGIAARVSDMDTQTARNAANGPVMKAGQPATFTKSDAVTIR